MIATDAYRDWRDPEIEPENITRARRLLKNQSRATTEAILIACYGQPLEVKKDGNLWVWPRMAEYHFTADGISSPTFIADTPPLRYSQVISFEPGTYNEGLGWIDGDLFDCLVVHAVALFDGDVKISNVSKAISSKVLGGLPLTSADRDLIVGAIGDIFMEIYVRSRSIGLVI